MSTRIQTPERIRSDNTIADYNDGYAHGREDERKRVALGTWVAFLAGCMVGAAVMAAGIAWVQP